MTPHSLLRSRQGHTRVTYVELFFDLVFVFAVTQLSHSLVKHLDLAGSLQTLLLMLAVWWVWIYTCWFTNWVDPDKPAPRVMLFLLMGVGLIFSSIVKTDTSIPLLINLFAFPQMLLSGTFFQVEVFPPWLQQICRLLPLTQFNDSMRKISFTGLHLWDCGRELGILAIWTVLIYIVAIKVFKWE